GLVSPSQTVDLAPLAFGRAPRTAVAHGEHRDRIAGRRAVLVRGDGDRRSDTLDERPAHHQDAVESGDAHAHLIPGLYGLCRLRALTIHPHMPCPACGRRG